MMHADAAFTAAVLGHSPEADDSFDSRILCDAVALLNEPTLACLAKISLCQLWKIHGGTLAIQ